MSFHTFFRQCAIRFFIITTCVNLAEAIFGPILLPDKTFGFTAFYSPLIAGALATLLSFILYSRKELNLQQTILRKSLYLLALEILLTGFGWLNGNILAIGDALIFMGMVLAVYVVVNLIGWMIGINDAKQINKGLRSLQNRK